jgi:hypothetical protein
MKAHEILDKISRLGDLEMNLFLYSLDNGFENEWDCNLIEGLERFSLLEFKIAAKTGAQIAERAEMNKSWG